MFVTEAYNESILLQDNTKMFHFLDLWNSTVSLLFAQRERERERERSSNNATKDSGQYFHGQCDTTLKLVL